jgi:hypothetical protein
LASHRAPEIPENIRLPSFLIVTCLVKKSKVGFQRNSLFLPLVPLVLCVQLRFRCSFLAANACWCVLPPFHQILWLYLPIPQAQQYQSDQDDGSKNQPPQPSQRAFCTGIPKWGDRTLGQAFFLCQDDAQWKVDADTAIDGPTAGFQEGAQRSTAQFDGGDQARWRADRKYNTDNAQGQPRAHARQNGEKPQDNGRHRAKGDRDELAIQAATELGVFSVIPWEADRSISKWIGLKEEKAVARWQTIVTEAAKQSLRSFTPIVKPAVATLGLSQLVSEFDSVLILDPTAEQGLGSLEFSQPQTLAIVVGPEGGISPQELEQLESAGAKRVRLGQSILRTSTAGVAAIAAIMVKTNLWR